MSKPSHYIYGHWLGLCLRDWTSPSIWKKQSKVLRKLTQSDLLPHSGMRDGRYPPSKFYETRVYLIASALNLRGLVFTLHLNARWFMGRRPLVPRTVTYAYCRSIRTKSRLCRTFACVLFLFPSVASCFGRCCHTYVAIQHTKSPTDRE